MEPVAAEGSVWASAWLPGCDGDESSLAGRGDRAVTVALSRVGRGQPTTVPSSMKILR
jgi:hypothetical protein